MILNINVYNIYKSHLTINISNLDVYTEGVCGYDKPSVLVTSPGSPDIHSGSRSAIRHPRQFSNNPNVGGRLQVILIFIKHLDLVNFRIQN